MATDQGYYNYVVDQLAQVATVRAKPMFGGVGLYSQGVFFGLIAHNALYFAVDATNRAVYDAVHAPAWGRGYREVPPFVLEDAEHLAMWLGHAVEVAQRKQTHQRHKERKP